MNKQPVTKLKIKYELVSVLEMLSLLVLFLINAYLANSANLKDFSIILAGLVLAGTLFQMLAFFKMRRLIWRLWIILGISLHIVSFCYLLVMVSFSGFADAH